MRTVLIGLALAFGLGGCLGSNMTDEPSPKFIEVPHTKIVQAPTPDPVTTTVMPASCIRAIAIADSISRGADKMYTYSNEQLDIISDVRSTLAVQGDLSPLDERQRRFQGNVIDGLYKVGEALSYYKTVRAECEKESK